MLMASWLLQTAWLLSNAKKTNTTVRIALCPIETLMSVLWKGLMKHRLIRRRISNSERSIIHSVDLVSTSLPSSPPQSAEFFDFCSVDFPQLFQFIVTCGSLQGKITPRPVLVAQWTICPPPPPIIVSLVTSQYICRLAMISEGQDCFFKNSNIIYLVQICWNPLWSCCPDMRCTEGDTSSPRVPNHAALSNTFQLMTVP